MYPLARSALLSAALAIACQSTSVLGATAKPILISAPNSTRAVAIEEVSFLPEPFVPQSSSVLYGVDRTSRIILFALNLSLQSDNDAPLMTANAEDAAHRKYDLRVEYVGKVQSLPWLAMIVVRLDESMGDLGDVLVQTTYQGVASNRVRVGIGHLGGGPPDDPGAVPTPAPPYKLKGQITVGGLPFAGVAVRLTEAATAEAITDADGMYFFSVPAVGDYTITPTQKFFTFTPTRTQIVDLASNRTVNFVAVRDTFVLSGSVRDDQGNGLDGVSVKVERAGVSPTFAVTANGGNFSFKDVLGGFAYTVMPQTTSVFAFSSQSIPELDRNTDLSFSGTRRSYTIAGFISDREHRGVSGVTVNLSGAATATAVTDANGNYSFPNLLAGRSYTVTAAKTNYFVNPTAQTFNLQQEERADFSAIRFYIISGRVTDAGKGLYGIIMSLAGPETASVRTASDGSYSFTVTSVGNYQLTPSREQNFYQFSPAQQSLSVTDHLTANFTGGIVISSPTYVLEFDGTEKTVDYSIFWPSDTNVGHFFWEFWAMPGNDNYTRYILSDGYGGAHALLFGFNYGPPGHYNLMGNVWIGSGVFYFNSDDGPSAGEWGHYAVGWDGRSIITYYDGVPVGKQAFTGPRVSTGLYNGATLLLIGGSNHQNFIGRIAQVRGYEENNPHEASPESTFRPQTFFSVEGQLLSYYFSPAPLVADLSYGYNGVQHNGWPRGFTRFYFEGCDGCPAPQFVLDPTAPNFADSNNPGSTTTLVGPPPPIPAGAAVFDSFSRNNSTYILNGHGGLGPTETGAQTWQTNVDASQPQPFGILSGRAVVLADATALAWVNVPTADMDVRVDRTRGQFGSGSNTGLGFRVLDKNNFFFAYSHDDQSNPSGPKKLAVGYYQAGVRTNLTDAVTLPSDWITLRVVTTATGSIAVYADGSQVYSTSNPLNAGTTAAGLFNFGPGLGLQNRWDNFAIFNAQ